MLRTLLAVLVVALVFVAPAAAAPPASGDLTLVSATAGGTAEFAATWDVRGHDGIILEVVCPVGGSGVWETRTTSLDTPQPWVQVFDLSSVAPGSDCAATLSAFRVHGSKTFYTLLDQVLFTV